MRWDEGVRSERGPDVYCFHSGAIPHDEEAQEKLWRGRQGGWRLVEVIRSFKA